MLVISFAREENGMFSHATLSNIDGLFKASWTIRDGEWETETEVEMDDVAFHALWDDLNEPVFVRHRVTSADTPLDFAANYLIGITFDAEGQAGMHSCLIPPTERDPVWVKWLERLEATKPKA